MLGAVNNHTVNNTYINQGQGHIHWMKIWYDDIGEGNAYQLAAWCHEKIRMEYWGKGKYELSDNSGNVTGASFICNHELAGRQYYMNSTNTNAGGWDACLMRKFCNGRLYSAMPVEWRALIKEVQIRATIGSQSTDLKISDDRIYLASYYEIGVSGAGYDGEVGVDVNGLRVPWFVGQGTGNPNTQNAQRIKWLGRIRTYALGNGNTTAYDGTPYIYTSTDDPAATFSTRISRGSIWLKTNNSSVGYYYLPQEEITQYGITPEFTASSTYGGGGWVQAKVWWLRSAAISYSASFMYVTTNGGASNGVANSSIGVVPGFSI